MRKALFLAVLTATAVTTALCAKQPETVSGIAKVVDGDSLDRNRAHSAVRDRRARGPTALHARLDFLAVWHGGSRQAACLDRQRVDRLPAARRTDDQRIVAVCKKGPVDLDAAMVKAGLALAYRQYSEDYVDEEDDARRAKRGMWAGELTPPWDYRHSTPGWRAPRG